MMSKRFVLSVILASAIVAWPAFTRAQTALPDVSGTWRAQTPDGPTEVIVRPDSSASLGEETVRWRLEGDTLLIAFGDEWMAYRYVFQGRTLTLSGGDLEEPVTLEHVGPATPRPEGVAIPPAPPADRRAVT